MTPGRQPSFTAASLPFAIMHNPDICLQAMTFGARWLLITLGKPVNVTASWRGVRLSVRDCASCQGVARLTSDAVVHWTDNQALPLAYVPKCSGSSGVGAGV